MTLRCKFRLSLQSVGCPGPATVEHTPSARHQTSSALCSIFHNAKMKSRGLLHGFRLSWGPTPGKTLTVDHVYQFQTRVKRLCMCRIHQLGDLGTEYHHIASPLSAVRVSLSSLCLSSSNSSASLVGQLFYNAFLITLFEVERHALFGSVNAHYPYQCCKYHHLCT